MVTNDCDTSSALGHRRHVNQLAQKLSIFHMIFPPYTQFSHRKILCMHSAGVLLFARSVSCFVQMDNFSLNLLAADRFTLFVHFILDPLSQTG